MSSLLPPNWRAPAGCPGHLRHPLERHVNRFPAEYLSEPQDNEVFDTFEEAHRRLSAFALVQGFDIVKNGGQTSINPGGNLRCIYHGNGTRNWRELEERVERDEAGAITSNRKRDLTVVRGTGCPWRCLVTFKSIGKRDSGKKGFVLSVKCLSHGDTHPLSPENPLIFYSHRQSLEEYQEALAQARFHRMSIIPYSVSRRVLASGEVGFVLKRREYYNSVRHGILDKTNETT